MATQLKTSTWDKTLSLNRQMQPPIYQKLLDIQRVHSIDKHNNYFLFNEKSTNTSFLHSQKLRQSLLESKKAFLNQSLEDGKHEEDQMEEKSIVLVQNEHRKVPSKKISFKIKKSSSIYKRNTGPKVTTINANTVAELTKKFNEMVQENLTIMEKPEIRRLVQRVNSQRSSEGERIKVARKPSIKSRDFNIKVTRKPSVKNKPIVDTDKNLVIITTTKPVLNRKIQKLERTNSDNKMCVRAKIGYLEKPHVIPKPEEIKPIRPNSLSLNTTSSCSFDSQISPTSGSVKATIEIFERKSSLTNSKDVPKIVPKPKVPEKNFVLKQTDSKPVLPVLTIDKPDDPICDDVTVKKSEQIVPIENIIKAVSPVDEYSNQDFKTDLDVEEEEKVQIINIPAILPQRRCDSMYETTNLRKISPPQSIIKPVKSEEVLCKSESPPKENKNLKPNTSFLWRSSQDKSPSPSVAPPPLQEETNKDSWETIYDTVDIKACELKEVETPEVPPRPAKPPSLQPKVVKKKMPLPQEEKIYEELNIPPNKETISIHNYEECDSVRYEDIEPKPVVEDDYEPLEPENIYETLPAPPLGTKRYQQVPLPPRPPSRTYYSSEVSNCYESIYNASNKKEIDTESNYESIYGCHITADSWSNRDSLVSSDQQSNSLYNRSLGWGDEGTYNGKATSDFSSSDRSDEWVDMTDNEDGDNKNTEIIIVREKLRNKKSGWSQHCREQWSKTPSKIPQYQGVDSDSDHHYESLHTKHETYHDDDYDSFDSDSDSEHSFTHINSNDSGVEIGNNQLPDPPNSQPYVLTRLAATAGKHMRKLRRNWSLTKNDISKSLSRMTKRKSRTDLDTAGSVKKEERAPALPPKNNTETTQNTPDNSVPDAIPPKTAYQNVEFTNGTNPQEQPEKEERTSKSMRGKSFLNKFRRSMSMSAENASELTSNLGNKPKSTFYLTETIDVDEIEKAEEAAPDSGVSLSPVLRHSKSSNVIIRPQSPPPPAPLQNSDSKKTNKKDKRASSWYAEVGLFRNENVPKRPNTFWYAEVGLYQTSPSTPSTSSAENSGSTTNITFKPSDFINQDNNEEYYNMKNDSNYYNESINSFSSTETKKDESMPNISQDIQLLLQDEPLYQFYDAAVLASVCQDGISEFDSDAYEEVNNKKSLSLSSRPSAMEIITPKRNSIAFTKTLWCEVPEVIQSSVLSTLSPQQKKLQEAKFEMITSEASYQNSLNVLTDHFVTSFSISNIITSEEMQALFGPIVAVKECSEKLLLDLERCWQDNILLNGVCEIILKHSEENFNVYIPYCENQILLDGTLKKLKEKPGFLELLRQLEANSACQSLTLHSFLMLPMQRITRWPLLIDAVLRRLSQQDSEYLTCQYALATLNKIVSQCNEAARKKERECELKTISTQLEFPKGVPSIEIVTPSRWLIKSGVVTHLAQRTDETKLTFGKRFIKSPLHLYLFDDFLFVTKSKSETTFSVMHYCPRNLVELTSTESIISLPVKDTQGKFLLFLTLLENQDQKTVEFLISCSSESDKERWIEALTPPKSEDPNETLYECWDCPQVTAIHNYVASQPDELAVSRGDVINVLRKMADGWYHGERIRDGQTGWFPANYTVEVANPHVRARNLKQRYRLLAFSENYLKSK